MHDLVLVLGMVFTWKIAVAGFALGCLLVSIAIESAAAFLHRGNRMRVYILAATLLGACFAVPARADPPRPWSLTPPPPAAAPARAGGGVQINGVWYIRRADGSLEYCSECNAGRTAAAESPGAEFPTTRPKPRRGWIRRLIWPVER